jgi:hypothetical protein
MLDRHAIILEREYATRNPGDVLVLEGNVFKIATTYSKVREFLTSNSWEYLGRDKKLEMDMFRNKKTGKKLVAEDISDGFPVAFLMGELSVEEFREMAMRLTPEIDILEVDSRWEGKPTTVVVAMTEAQVRNVFFGKRTKMRRLEDRATALVAKNPLMAAQDGKAARV